MIFIFSFFSKMRFLPENSEKEKGLNIIGKIRAGDDDFNVWTTRCNVPNCECVRDTRHV